MWTLGNEPGSSAGAASPACVGVILEVENKVSSHSLSVAAMGTGSRGVRRGDLTVSVLVVWSGLMALRLCSLCLAGSTLSH